HADGKCVCVPRCDGAESMSARELHIGDELVTGRFGLIEPLESAPIVPPEKIDLAIVPSVACGRDFNRIGNGGGYYDRYLASCTAFKLALCPDALLARTRPCGAHDIKMDVIVTECETLKNKNAARKPL
ncbi:MAG: 5-formyltetrahydrofolate cyclo-ligase, partial [Oscillospiraceae bacterium]